MNVATATLHAAFTGGTEPPSWVHLVPAGEFRGVDGRGPYRLRDAAAVMAATKLPLPVDENHATDFAAPAGGPSPARGWVVELQARADGIWGRVEWTPSGAQLLAERAYRGISPVFTHAQRGGAVLSLLRAALTNNPNLADLATLHSQEDRPTMDLLAQLRALHGLPADADATAALDACRAAHAAQSAHATQLGAIAKAAGLDGAPDATAIATAIQAQRGEAGNVKAMREELVALQARLSEVTAAQARERAERVVDEAIKAGKPIPKSLRDHYVARHAADPKSVETELAGLPSLHAGGIERRPAAAAEDDPVVIARQAQELQDKERAAGREISTAAAVQRVLAARKSA